MEYDAFADALVAGAKSYIDAQVSPILQRLAALEARSPAEPVPGVGIQSAVRNRGGDLILVLTDGRLLNVGQIDGKDAPPVAPETVAAMIAEQIARIPPAPAGKDAPRVLAADVAGLLKSELEPTLRALVFDAVASLPAPVDGADGADADMVEVTRLIAAEVTRQVGEIPPAKDGEPGATPDPAEIVRMVTAEVGQMVPGLVERAVAALPKPADGKSITVDELLPVLEPLVERCVAARPPAKDGVGVTGALIDREGRLVLTLSDGTVKELGVVLGKNADMATLAAICVREIENIPRPRDGIDGLGFEDLQVIHDGERLVTFRFIRGDQTKAFTLTIPAIIDRGIWREGKFAKGDGVTWEGSFFIAQCDTEQKPLLHPDWRQAVKAGRPGKHTESVKYLPATVKLAAKSDNAAA